ncbi:actin remodeling regulator NHS isoform X2 [Cebidichthys violaceus]|uniref:actin remodeling regulator NHS isoform X2 n=1 Tax=Cebidichthys violaceus TaxID=271503 RepID=UPI0035CA567B
MPFAKRLVEPRLLCRRQPSDEEAPPVEDLVSVSNVALSRTLRQLSDLAKHACSVFQELEDELAATGLRVRGLQGRITGLQQGCAELDPKQEAVPVSNLDVESKLTTHFRSPWLQQRNILRPSTRPACVVDLHRQASLSLWAPHRDHQRRRSGSRERRVTISIPAEPPMPEYPPTPIAQPRGTDQTTFESTRSSSPTECCRFSPWSRKAALSDPDTDEVALGHRPKFPVPNTPTTLDKQTNWSRALPLPTPEERMKTSSQVINSCVIPINVTGVGFDRDASVRCSLVHSQSVLQRRRKLRRRRTVAGVPRQVQRDLDSDDSPGSRERTVIVHSPDITPSTEELDGHLGTRDSGCQTEDFLISGAPSRRRIRSQRGQAVSLSLSHSAGNILFLSDSADAMFSASVGARLRSRSLPRDGSRMVDDGHSDDDDEEELSPFDAEDFLPRPGELILKDGEESVDDRVASDRQLGLKYKQLSESPEHSWMERTRSRLPRKADMGSCEISSSSDTFSSPVHSVSAAGVQLDHKEDHQSSSGNWSGSSSTCPSQTSETIPPAASPPLTGSSHCDSELSLNVAAHGQDDHAGFLLDHYHGLRTQRAGSFSSTAMDILEEAGVSAPMEVEWSYPDAETQRPRDFSPDPSREAESSLGCPSFTSMATCESSFSDKPPSEKADAVSHYSVDTEGYYTSMHFDCGIKESRSFSYGCGVPGSESDFGGHMTLGRRCLSLRKPKAKPSPPKRSSSLRKICSEGHIPDNKEPKMSSKERKLQLDLSNSSLVREPLVVWGVEDSADLPDLGVFGATDSHSFKDEGVVQSDYADLWLLNDLKSSDPYRSLSNSSTATGTTVVECVKSQESSESQTSQSGSRATTPSLPSVEGDFKLTSPEKLAGLTSPSSGYSSQSETPTSSFPSTSAAFFPGPLSPSSGKRKPKVPERKSSLSTQSLQSLPSSRMDLELPIIPPSHLDLSALHGVEDKSLAYRTQIQILHQNKHKAPLSPKPAHPMFITPTALNSVQLRPIRTEDKGRHEDETTPTCPAENSTETLLCSSSAEIRSTSRLHRPPSEGSCESLFTSNEELADGECRSETRSVTDREEEAAFRPQSVDGYEGETCRESAATPETLQLQRSEEKEEEEEEEEEEEAAALSVMHSSPNGPDEVPAADGQSEASEGSPIGDEGSREEEFESPGASAQSASQDDQEESEDRFVRDSTPSENTASPLIDESRPEDNAVFLSPTKARTTEDLFAMIHRSKRKVLGRKDSTELNVRNHLAAASGNSPPSSTGSSPVSLVSPSSSSSAVAAAAAASAAVTPPGLHRVSGPIYRSAKKSSTSNEEFKLLLLKKGSRSESSYRMSATEILKSPVTPKSASDSLIESPRRTEEPDSPLQHQSGPDHLSSPYPKANAEGFSPKSFPTSAASRQGRPRIPPPANSSRYGARGRLYSVPMQAISEGEAENSDGSPHDDRSPQGST